MALKDEKALVVLAKKQPEIKAASKKQQAEIKAAKKKMQRFLAKEVPLQKKREPKKGMGLNRAFMKVAKQLELDSLTFNQGAIYSAKKFEDPSYKPSEKYSYKSEVQKGIEPYEELMKVTEARKRACYITLIINELKEYFGPDFINFKFGKMLLKWQAEMMEIGEFENMDDLKDYFMQNYEKRDWNGR